MKLKLNFLVKKKNQIIKKLAFEEVNGGTLFLKNIECLSSKNQGKLLRVFEEKNIEELEVDPLKKLILD